MELVYFYVQFGQKLYKINWEKVILLHSQWLDYIKKVIINAVDYAQVLLVTEPIEVLQDIVDSMIHTSKKDKLTKYLTATATFLKYRFNYHVQKVCDDCSTHDPKYILGRKSHFDNSVHTCEKSGITCPQCKFPFYVCYKIKQSVIEN